MANKRCFTILCIYLYVWQSWQVHHFSKESSKKYAYIKMRSFKEIITLYRFINNEIRERITKSKIELNYYYRGLRKKKKCLIWQLIFPNLNFSLRQCNKRHPYFQNKLTDVTDPLIRSRWQDSRALVYKAARGQYMHTNLA